jgi:hypothetical protein
MRRLLLFAVAWAGCGLRSEAPVLRSVSPARVCSPGAVTLALEGDAFTPLPTSVLAGASLTLPRALVSPAGTPGAAPSALAVEWRSEMRLDATLPQAGLEAGDYDVAVENPDGQQTTLAAALTAIAAPRVTGLSPTDICNSAVTIVINGAALEAGATVTLGDPSTGMTLAAQSVTVASPSQASAAFGASMFAKSAQLDLTLRNPDGCAVTLSNAVHIKPGNGGCP